MTAQAKLNNFTPEELQAVIEGIKNDDKAAGEQFYQWFKPMVWRYASFKEVRQKLAEDAENILWLELFIFIKKTEFTNYVTLPGLFKKVVIFKLLNSLKSKVYFDPNTISIETIEQYDYTTNLKAHEHNFNLLLLKDAFKELDEKQKTLVILYYVDGLTFQQIAQRLHMTERMVRYRHYKIINQLKISLT